MRSKLPIIAAMASVAIGLPLQAQTQQMMNRTEIITTIVVAQYHINTGNITEKTAHEIVKEILQEIPHLKPAYQWAINSSNAGAAVEGMAANFGPNCNGEVCDEVVENVILPNLNW